MLGDEGLGLRDITPFSAIFQIEAVFCLSICFFR